MAIVMLGLFQAGLVARFADRFEQATLRMKVGALIRWIDANQMRIYVVHLPLWVAQLLILRSTSLRLSSTPSLHWLVVRPLWLFGPGLVLWGTLSLRARMSNASRTASDS